MKTSKSTVSKVRLSGVVYVRDPVEQQKIVELKAQLSEANKKITELKKAVIPANKMKDLEHDLRHRDSILRRRQADIKRMCKMRVGNLVRRISDWDTWESPF